MPRDAVWFVTEHRRVLDRPSECTPWGKTRIELRRVGVRRLWEDRRAQSATYNDRAPPPLWHPKVRGVEDAALDLVARGLGMLDQLGIFGAAEKLRHVLH